MMMLKTSLFLIGFTGINGGSVSETVMPTDQSCYDYLASRKENVIARQEQGDRSYSYSVESKSYLVIKQKSGDTTSITRHECITF